MVLLLSTQPRTQNDAIRALQQLDEHRLSCLHYKTWQAKQQLLFRLNSCYSRWTCFSSLGFYSSMCSGKELLLVSGLDILWSRCSSCHQPSVSKHCKENKALTLTIGLASSFLQPPLESSNRNSTAPFMPAFWCQYQKIQQNNMKTWSNKINYRHQQIWQQFNLINCKWLQIQDTGIRKPI